MRCRWLPGDWRPRWRGKDLTPDWLEGFMLLDDSILLGLVLTVVIVLLVVLGLPLIILIAEAALAVLLLTVAVLGRVVLRKPWRIVVHRRTPPTEVHAWHVTGFLRSRRVMREIGDALREGRTPAPAGARRTPVRPGDH